MRELEPRVTEELDEVIMATLEADPKKRTQTMGELSYQLTKVLRGRGKAVAAVLGITSTGTIVDFINEAVGQRAKR